MVEANERILSRVTYADRFKLGLDRPGKDRKGAAKAMGISVQAVSAIARGATKSATAQNNAAAAGYFGCDAGWLATGKGAPDWADEARERAPALLIHTDQQNGTDPPLVRETLAHPVIPPGFTVAHKTVPWGDLPMISELPDEFFVAMPDDSMAPDVPAGTRVWFERREDARPPDVVLLTDDAGNWYIRHFKERRPGHWEAHAAEGSGRLPLDSTRDGLRVRAVYVGQRGRKGGDT